MPSKAERQRTLQMCQNCVLVVDGETYHWIARTIDANCYFVYIAVKDGNIYRITIRYKGEEAILCDGSPIWIADINILYKL